MFLNCLSFFSKSKQLCSAISCRRFARVSVRLIESFSHFFSTTEQRRKAGKCRKKNKLPEIFRISGRMLELDVGLEPTTSWLRNMAMLAYACWCLRLLVLANPYHTRNFRIQAADTCYSLWMTYLCFFCLFLCFSICFKQEAKMKGGASPQPSGITFASCRLYAATPEDHVYSLLFQVIAPSCNPRGSHQGHLVRSLYQEMRVCQCSFFGRPLLFSLLFSDISETNWPGKYD